MHIPPHDNRNAPIIDVNDARVPLNYFNIVKLERGVAFEYRVPGYETAIVPATGTVDVDVAGADGGNQAGVAEAAGGEAAEVLGKAVG